MKMFSDAAIAPQEGVRANRTSPVIVATDGHDQSNSAMLLGRLLASESDALRIVTVLKRLPSVTPEMPLPMSADVEAARRADQKRMVKHQAARVWGEELVDVEVCDGDPATAVTRLARTTNATIIVAGLGRHRVFDRMFGDETALRLIRLSSVPVFAVASGLSRAPMRVVVAVDFSETSLRAARLALEVASPSATVYLAHVGPRDSLLHEWNGWGLTYKDDAGDALQKMREQLRIPSGMIVQRVMLQGEPATELLAFATSVNADMIATGSHGHGFVARMLVGSVTTRIIRCSTCSVLCVPHAAAMTRAGFMVSPSVVKVLDRPEWSAKLNDFTNRNIGRRGTLEVDDPDIGAQAQEHDYPLLGAAYDPHDGRVELMFGELGDIGRHLTRSIGDVDEINTLTNDRGRDVALRISHGAGQTLLTFAE